jgi:hypothetical protein
MDAKTVKMPGRRKTWIAKNRDSSRKNRTICYFDFLADFTYEPVGRGFESLPAYQNSPFLRKLGCFSAFLRLFLHLGHKNENIEIFSRTFRARTQKSSDMKQKQRGKRCAAVSRSILI